MPFLLTLFRAHENPFVRWGIEILAVETQKENRSMSRYLLSIVSDVSFIGGLR
jgi:hypothetical protein